MQSLFIRNGFTYCSHQTISFNYDFVAKNLPNMSMPTFLYRDCLIKTDGFPILRLTKSILAHWAADNLGVVFESGWWVSTSTFFALMYIHAFWIHVVRPFFKCSVLVSSRCRPRRNSIDCYYFDHIHTLKWVIAWVGNCMDECMGSRVSLTVWARSGD